MKKHFIILLLSCLGLASYADHYTIDMNNDKSMVEINKNSLKTFASTLHFNTVNAFDVNTKQGMFTEINIPGTHSVGSIGTPKLPAFKKLIQIPAGAKATVKVVNYTEQEFYLADYGIQNKIFPVQPSVSKSQDPAMVKFEFDNQSYLQNRYLSNELATIEVLGSLRGMQIARLVVAPVSYNPVEGKIKVINDIEIEINFEGADKAEIDQLNTRLYSPYFQPIKDYFLNKGFDKGTFDEHPDMTKYPVKYVIISDPMFQETLQEFISWKVKKGFEVIEAYTDEIGSSVGDIQTYLADLYNAATETDPAPSFVLFVGDVQQIPASATGSSSGKKTDLYYCSIDGDYFPEMYYGRFSATSPDMLQNIIDKTLYYEQYQFEDPSYLDRVTLIAGADGTWNPAVGQPTVEYGTENYFNAEHGYATVNDYLNSYSGCYETVNEGVGFINYTAHCSETSWADPGLSISAVNNFTNENMYPLAVGNCCLAADFGYDQCMGETWLRAANKGAVAYIGSSPSSYWFEDFYWAVGAFPIEGNNDGYVPTFEESSLGAYDAPFASDYVSVDAMLFVGNLAVTEVDVQGYPQHSSPLYYWQAYNCLGDPSLIIYHTQGEVNDVSYMDVLPIGIDQFEVSAEPGSFVAISYNGILHGTAMADETGTANVTIEPILEAGMADIVITKPQYQPVMNQVMVAPLDGPYVLIDSSSVTDPTGNDNNMADYGEEVHLNIVMKNVGTVLASNVNVSIRTDDEKVTLIDSTESWGDIDSNDVEQIDDAFTFLIDNDIEDQHVITFNIVATDDSTTEPWESKFTCPVNAPVLDFGITTIEDSAGGNDNGRLDGGELVTISVNTVNNGHADTEESVCQLSTRSPYLNIINPSCELGVLETHAVNKVSYSLIVDPETPIGEIADITFTIEAGEYSKTEIISKKISLVLEDFESGDFVGFDWENSEDYPWGIDNDEFFEGTASAKSFDIEDEQSSFIQLDMEVASPDTLSFYKKVSSESGYDFLKFFIDGENVGEWSGEVDWTYEAYAVEAGTHTFKWTYQKDYSLSNGSDCGWIDFIVLPGGSGIMSNHLPQFANAPDTLFAFLNHELDFSLQLNDEDSDAVWVRALEMPEWMELSQHQPGICTLGGTPVADDMGETTLMLQADDGTSFNLISIPVIVDLMENVSEADFKNNIRIYPNPSRGKSVISYYNNEAGYVEIVLYNQLGEQVQSLVKNEQNAGNYQVEINLDNLIPGIYFCKINLNNKNITLPLMYSK